MRRSLFAYFVLLSISLFQVTGVQAQTGENKIALQISDGGPEKQELLLNVANNILKAYGPDNVKLEIVAFGPGLRLLFADNANKDLVQSLAATGVQFSACENTIKGMTKSLGKAPTISINAQVVPAGIVRLVDLSSQGYVVVRP